MVDFGLRRNDLFPSRLWELTAPIYITTDDIHLHRAVVRQEMELDGIRARWVQLSLALTSHSILL